MDSSELTDKINEQIGVILQDAGDAAEVSDVLKIAAAATLAAKVSFKTSMENTPELPRLSKELALSLASDSFMNAWEMLGATKGYVTLVTDDEDSESVWK